MITRKVAGAEATMYELALVTKSGRRVLLEVSLQEILTAGQHAKDLVRYILTFSR
jgi:hypothetical protein